MAQLLEDAYVDASFCTAGVAFSNELRIYIDKRRGYLLRSEQLSKGTAKWIADPGAFQAANPRNHRCLARRTM